MSPLALVVATALFLVISLIKDAVAVRAGVPVRPERHPLVILVGSLLSLLALWSLLRSLPAEAAAGWATFSHVGFICLWLVLMSRSSRSGRAEGSPGE